MIHSLSLALNLLTHFLAVGPANAHIPLIILIPSMLAMNRATDASPHEEQGVGLHHLEKLGELLTSYPAANVRLQWLSRKLPFVGHRVKQLAFEAICIADLTRIEEPHTIRRFRHQMGHARAEVFSERLPPIPPPTLQEPNASPGPLPKHTCF